MCVWLGCITIKCKQIEFYAVLTINKFENERRKRFFGQLPTVRTVLKTLAPMDNWLLSPPYNFFVSVSFLQFLRHKYIRNITTKIRESLVYFSNLILCLLSTYLFSSPPHHWTVLGTPLIIHIYIIIVLLYYIYIYDVHTFWKTCPDWDLTRGPLLPAVVRRTSANTSLWNLCRETATSASGNPRPLSPAGFARCRGPACGGTIGRRPRRRWKPLVRRARVGTCGVCARDGGVPSATTTGHVVPLRGPDEYEPSRQLRIDRLRRRRRPFSVTVSKARRRTWKNRISRSLVGAGRTAVRRFAVELKSKLTNLHRFG